MFTKEWYKKIDREVAEYVEYLKTQQQFQDDESFVQHLAEEHRNLLLCGAIEFKKGGD